MNEPVEAAIVLPGELVARFVTSKHWIRSSDNSVRPDAFMPPPDLNLSVTRHIGLSEEALWRIGKEVVGEIGQKRTAPLCGRADLSVESIPLPLKAEPAALPNNPNHAHVTGWPTDKPSKKNLAQQLSAVAHYLPLEQ